MSSAIFTDSNGHEIEIKRLQYTISDSISYEESSDLKQSVKVDIDGWMKRTEIKNYKVWSKSGSSVKRNLIGKIVFKDVDGTDYMKINDIYIISVEETSETWREWGQVRISFSNEGMNTGQSQVIKFNNKLDIYNAQISITPSIIRKNFSIVPYWDGSFYQETGYEITRIILNGVIPYDSCTFPESIISEFEVFNWENGVYVPVEKDLSDFLIGIGHINIKSVFIENASLTWSIERKCINVNISFVAPHQDIKKESNK